MKPTKQRARIAPQARRQAIIAAAQRVLASRGFEATTIKEIAAEAQVAHGLMFHYFRSKEELLLAVAEAEAEAVSEEVEPAALRTPEQAKKGLGLARARIRQRPGWYRLRFELFALALRNPQIRGGVAHLLAAGRKRLEPVVRAVGIPSGTTATGATSLMLALMDGIALQALVDDTFDLDHALEAVECLWAVRKPQKRKTKKERTR